MLKWGIYRGDKQKSLPECGKALILLKYYDHPLLSGNGFVSPFPIKTIQVLAITALIAAVAFIPVLYVVVLIMIRYSYYRDAKLNNKLKRTNPHSKFGRRFVHPELQTLNAIIYNRTPPAAFLPAYPDRAAFAAGPFQ